MGSSRVSSVGWLGRLTQGPSGREKPLGERLASNFSCAWCTKAGTFRLYWKLNLVGARAFPALFFLRQQINSL